MAEGSTFRETLNFFNDIGVFDVVLPFLLVFTIVFALLEKTRVFGTDKVGDQEFTKKHLNSLASFVIAFFVIASSTLVEMITKISSNVVILLLGGVLFLLLAGTLNQQKPEGYFLEGHFKTLFMLLMFAGLAFIFLNAIETKNKSWLDWIFEWVRSFDNNVGVSSIILIGAVVAVLYFITNSRGDKAASGNGK